MKIGNVNLKNPIIAAPMAGVTDKAFRKIAKNYGCSLTFTEMVSSKAVLYKNKKTKSLYDITGEKAPIGVQIFGSDVNETAAAANEIEKCGADIIDINMGCPTPKIVKNNEGAALMLEPDKAAEIIKQVVKNVAVPVTVKIRKGWDEKHVNCIEIAQIAEKAGASAVTVHGRTREQFYSGKADWEIIKKTVNTVSIPVIGNGDVFCGEDAVKMLEYTGCAGVMIARGAMGNPWIFKEAVNYISGLKEKEEPTPFQKIEAAIKHLYLTAEFKDEIIAVKEMRKHTAWYIKGLKNASKLREQINRMESLDEMNKLLNDYISSD
jgi:nifR3 family TIM-barrel protein